MTHTRLRNQWGGGSVQRLFNRIGAAPETLQWTHDTAPHDSSSSAAMFYCCIAVSSGGPSRRGDLVRDGLSFESKCTASDGN